MKRSSRPPLNPALRAPQVLGKSGEGVCPPTVTVPAASTAMQDGRSNCEFGSSAPPETVE
jgi:hypothetical protein